MNFDPRAKEPRQPRNPVRDGIDFRTLPLDTLLDIQKVVVVTSMSRDTIKKKVAAQEFPHSIIQDKESLWEWGEVRRWLHMIYGEDDFA